MKKIIQDHLSKRLPADDIFLNFVDEDARKNLIALCAPLFPDSENNAYVLAGLNSTINYPIINYTQGYVFYNNEIFFVPAFSYNQNTQFNSGLKVQKIITKVEYESGELLPAYEDSIMVVGDGVTGPLALLNLIRKEFGNEQFQTNLPIAATYLQYPEAKLIWDRNTQMLLIHVQILQAAASINTKVSIPCPEFKRVGLLGFGKIINRDTQQIYDVSVINYSGNILIQRPWDKGVDALKWSELWEYANPQQGRGIDPGDPGNPNNPYQPLILYVNIIHSRNIELLL